MFIIIPAKPFKQSKTRLANVLSAQQRINLSRRLFQRTLKIAGQVGQVVVVSHSSTVRRLAKEQGAWSMVETGTGLNEAVQQAAEWVLARQGQTILILPGDLPQLRLGDLTAMLSRRQAGQTAVIAPCHRGDGTNAFLLSPPNLIEFAFGPGSFERHRQAVLSTGVAPIIYRSGTIAFDVDVPEDLAMIGVLPASE